MPKTSASSKPTGLVAVLLREGRELLDTKLTHYQVLQITPDAAETEPTELTAARARLARLYHPDRFPAEHAKLAHDVMSRANVAYQVLADPRERKVYRLTLGKTHYACGTCRGAGRKRKTAGFTGVVWIDCGACDGAGYLHKDTI